MPQQGSITPDSAWSDFSLAGKEYGAARFKREQFDYQQQRDKARQDIEQQRFQLQQEKDAREAQRQMETLKLQQETNQRAAQQLQLSQDAALRAQQDQDREDYVATHPNQPPPKPDAPKEPDYQSLGTDPMQNYDEPTELESLNKSLMLDVARRLQVPGADGQPAQPFTIAQSESGEFLPPTTLPMDSILKARERFTQLVGAGVPPAEAQSQVQNEMFGQHPRYLAGAPAVPAASGWFGTSIGATEAKPAQPGRIEPDTATVVPPRQIDPSQGYSARRKALADDYQKRMTEYEQKRGAFEGYKPPVYPGFPWRQRVAEQGENVPQQPAPGVPSTPGSKPQPQPNPAPAAAQPMPKKITTKGGNVVEFD